ncbi:EAL domain-containing protein [Sphingomonas sp. C3-2]|uniref:bifunctional diguanylate cyclase/phosphodiesterase n=1 Tax=Sphingomonas sp. C3-2 TaxID=3062169 RepID=UPI00294B46E0|nr:EAL domain-containing protein [Sphingomonas sp. C3-2]WOK36325.1 EAL domain-containing protein [Sphingomonas sp. C3-2]
MTLHHMIYQHDWRLVLLAGLMCIASTFSAVLLLRQACAARPMEQGRWVMTAGLATGVGVWATHFVAMLGYDPGFAVGYTVDFTIASLAVAIAMMALGFGVAVRKRAMTGAVIGAVLVGGGIAAMHYLGMMALGASGALEWHAGLVEVSIVLAIVPTIAGLRLTVMSNRRGAGIAAGVLLTLAVLMLHFVGMASVALIPHDAEGADTLLLSSPALAGAIALAALGITALCMVITTVIRRAEGAIRESERQFRILVQGITDCALYMLHADGTIASWNAGAARLKGYRRAEVVGQPLHRFYCEADRDAGAPERALATALEQGKFVAEGWRVRKDGSRFWAHVTIEKVVDEFGDFCGFAKITRDMSREKEAQDELAALTAKLDAALSNMHQGLCMFDAEQRLVLANSRFGELWGLPEGICAPGIGMKELTTAALKARSGKDAAPERIETMLSEIDWSVASASCPPVVLEFEDLMISITSRPMPGGGWVSTSEDITERQRAEARIKHMAMHDGLTGLPNRIHFNERLGDELDRAALGARKVGVIAIDLDRFKEINDTRGHAVGDEVLQQLAARMCERQADGEMLARLGGDEFAGFKQCADMAELEEFVFRMEACLTEALDLSDGGLAPGASIGVAIYPADGDSAEQVLNNADLAMYRAKNMVGHQVCFYEKGMDESARARRQLAHDLRDAISGDQLALAYQVQKSIRTGEVIGYEALLRWTHPERGAIAPADFIPIAEETGEILKIGEWVLRTACADAAQWCPPRKVAVNLSPVQLMHGDIVGIVARTLAETGLSADRLELEITETAIVSDKERALHLLREIKALGVSIAIDDFGTGYSSLDTLNSFPFDKIKIDKSFLLDSDTNHQARAIIRAVLALGRSLDMPVLAEGLESEEQLRLLQSEGCDEAQGYLFGRPAPLADAKTNERAA